jgi:hypothetical protein
MNNEQMPYLAQMNFYDNGSSGVLAVIPLSLGVDTIFEVKSVYEIDSERFVKLEDTVLTIINPETEELLVQVSFLKTLQALGAKVIGGNDTTELWYLEAKSEQDIVEKLSLK